MKTFYLLRRRDESVWSVYITAREEEIDRQYRSRVKWATVWGVLGFITAAAYLLGEPLAYAIARYWK